MKKFRFLVLISMLTSMLTSTSNGNELSCFNTPSQFYSRDFEFKKGMKVLSFEHKIGIVDDEVFVGRPRIYFNDSILVCDCGKEALYISFKSGDVAGYCQSCAGRKIKDFEKYNSPIKSAQELNKHVNTKPKGTK